MITTKIASKAIAKGRWWRESFIFSYLSIVALVIALLLGGAVTALALGGRFGNPGIYAIAATAGAFLVANLLFLRRDEIATTIIIMVCLVVDWYLGIHLLGLVAMLALLVVIFLARSPSYPWVKPRALWLWALFLL